MQLPEDDFHLLESGWQKLSSEKKVLCIENAASFAPESSFSYILAGLASDHPPLRNKARESLAAVKLNILKLLADPDQHRTGMTRAASICAKLYARIHPDLPGDDLKFFFRTLVTFEGKGAYFAFKALYRGRVPEDVVRTMILTISEPDRMRFVDQYLYTGPGLRLKFGHLFKDILTSIQERETVVHFFARLFDEQRDADPFLNNIRAEVRNPDGIIAEKIRSPLPEQRMAGLKALSMMVTRISTDLLKDLLIDETVQKVRITIYNLIEASPVGLYRDLCYPILQFFYQREEKEAVHAFKALVVSGKFPPHRLLKIISTKYPSLLPVIYGELTTLSRFSFLIIQDIALNKEKYLDTNFDANLACVLGMVRKRPERMIKILSENTADRELTLFVEKTKTLLAKEENRIETEADPVTRLIHNKLNRSDKSVLASTLQRIKALNTGRLPRADTRFEDDLIVNARFSSNHSPLFFNNSILYKGNLSKIILSNTVFRKSIFYHVDMHGAEFEGVNFDDAVFINVNAAGAKFKNCSFANVSVYNSDFSRANLKDALFLNATVSKTLFEETDLSGSCFAYSKISCISFSNALLNQADFSDVRARFCKFQRSENLAFRKQNLEFNAREFQLSATDLPPLDHALVSKVNKQLFCEFIHYGEKKFLGQNQLSLLTACDIFKAKQTDLFRLIPLFLHENIPLPGMEEIHSPCGIWNYLPDSETLEVLSPYLPGKPIPARRSKNPVVQGLFTMGSVGSIAQAADSDIDYWVCIREENLNSQSIKQLKKKLELLEDLALKQFETKVTFFIVDILKVRQNDFGDFTCESSGSAQSRLLKEEFYRTMVYIAGKIPLWAVLPSAISINYYDLIKNSVLISSENSRYIDLGDINAISTSEYFGGSLWQMFKFLNSPFKSLIKMALLENFLNEYGKTPLLCNQYKDEWLNSGAQLKLTQNDSYYILVEHLLAYFEKIGDDQSAELLLTCFFLKLGISQNSQINNTVLGLRKILLEQCLRRWGWSRLEVIRIGRFKTWKYADIAAVSRRIKTYMIKKCKLVNKGFSGHAKISPEDLTVLGRKIYIEFSEQPGRVDKVFMVSRRNRDYQRLNLRYLEKIPGEGMWELFNRSTKALHFKEQVLTQADTIEEIGAWLIHNGLYNRMNVIHLVPNPSFVTFDDIQNLYRAMHDFFSSVPRKDIGFDQLLINSEIVALFVSINFYVPAQQETVADFTMVYLNSWGEMLYESVVPKGRLTIKTIQNEILSRLDIKELPSNTIFYSAKEKKGKKTVFSTGLDHTEFIYGPDLVPLSHGPF